MSRARLYLAGPEVFLPDALAVARAKQDLCARHGFEGVFPLDASLDLTGLPKREQARRISAANEAAMRSCAGLIANLTPFRGVSMDAGTAFEVGFMRALGGRCSVIPMPSRTIAAASRPTARRTHPSWTRMRRMSRLRTTLSRKT